MKDSELTLDKKKAIDSAISTAADHFGLLIKELAHDLAKERRKAQQLAQQLAHSKAQLSAKSAPSTQPKSEPKLPAGFRYSPDLQQKRNQLAAEQAVVRVQEARELASFEARTLETIAARNKKIVEEMEYNKAIKGSFAVAMGAIARRKAVIETTGETIITDINGNTAKCELDLDNNKLFTFERLTLPEFELLGKTYKITQAELSPINAGNVYYFQKSN